MASISKILIANRGEIAIRVARTCRESGIRTVAICSEPDRHAAHVRYADEAYEIGPAPSSESYLAIDKILVVAEQSGCDAIHPGYGFLSENADFAAACEAAGFIFIGPTPAAIRAMGDKTAARSLMRDAGVPMAPGSDGAVASDSEAEGLALQVGYPVLIKAAAGGGGKGMRIVREPGDLDDALRAARGEAQSAFGDDRVFVEKFIEQPRHIEFQILADAHGNCIHLFERECSIQRRHQKVVEEAPSAAMNETLRESMGRAAVRAAQAVDYRGAGTIEFLVDQDGHFYFMEMNTRLQVEHPVTEWITGVDLVAEQIRVAEGKPLVLQQRDLTIRGHAIECRVYAEDPENDFLPDPAVLTRHRLPSGPGVRVDAGVEEGDEIPIYYDPMISKVTTWGTTRDDAIGRMIRAIDEYEIAGPRTTLSFCRFAVNHDVFRSGVYSTAFVREHFQTKRPQRADDEIRRLAAIAATAASMNGRVEKTSEPSIAPSSWLKRREYK